MEGYCLTGQSPQWAVVPMEEEEVFKYVILYSVIPQVLELKRYVLHLSINFVLFGYPD